MQTTTAPFKTTVAGNDLTVDFKVTIAGVTYTDQTPAVVSIDVDRQLTTDMPDGTRLITGYPSASATIVLGGMVDPTDETKTAAWLFNPNSTGSPLYRTDVLGKLVTIEAGVWLSTGVERVTIFTGTIDDNQTDGQAGTVTLTCLDYRQKLRTVPVLPGIGSEMDVPYGGLQTVQPGLTAGWVIDTLLRANGIYQSPGPRTGCAMYASMSGSVYPQIRDQTRPVGLPQTAYTVSGAPMRFTQGNWSDEVCYTSQLLTVGPASTIVLDTSGGFLGEWWMLATTPDSSTTLSTGMYFAASTLTYSLSVSLTQSAPSSTTWVFQSAGGINHNITLSAVWHQFTVRVNIASTTSATTRLWVDGTLINTWTETISIAGGQPTFSVEMRSIHAVEAFQITNELAGTPALTFIPTAVLDASLNPLTATVDISGRDPWAVIQELDGAEGAVGGFDELGVFRFTNRDNINTASAVRTISALSSLKTATVQQGLSTVANHVTAPVNVLARSTYQAVWSANIVYGVQPRSTRKWTVNTDNPVIGMSATCIVIPSGGVTPIWPNSGYRASHNHASEVSNLTMTVQQLGPTSFVITITNPNSFIAFLETPPGGSYPAGSVGQPALWIGGEFVTAAGSNADTTAVTTDAGLGADSQWPPVEEGGAALNPRGEIALPLAANPWRQDLDTTQAFTDDLLADLYKPRPLLRNVGIVADPSLQLADRVTVVDPDGTLVNDDAYIVGIHTTISGTDWAQTVDMRMINTPGGWILGKVGQSELNVTTYV